MRSLRIISAFLVLISSALAADVTIRVTDPQQANVPGARIAVFGGGSEPVAIVHASGSGIASISGIRPGRYRVQVLAAGFQPANVDVTVPSESVTIQLRVASISETVVVTAAATPVVASESGTSMSALDGKQIEVMNQQELGDTIRFIPGAYVSNAGRRGGLTTLFVRGGESRYNKVIIDGVPVNDPGGTFNLSLVPVQQLDRLELLRGSESTLYGSDAMTSVVQTWTATGASRVPEVRFGADGGTFATAHGYASVAGAAGRFDYNVFGDQFNSEGQGINDVFSNSLQGANLGARLSDNSTLRFRVRHSNARTGVPGGWLYTTAVLAPDADQYARQNDTLASLDLNVALTPSWLNRFTGFEYNHKRRNTDQVNDPGRPFDDPYDSRVNFNRAGFQYHSEYIEREWARTIFGYQFEVENGFIDNDFVTFGFPGESRTHGLRRNHALYVEQIVNRDRLSAVAGVRYEHNESFGNRGVPRVSIAYLAARGGEVFSGTRLRASYSEGIKAPTFEESFGITGTFPTIANPDLEPERSRSLEAGFIQSFFAGRYSLAGTYFNNRFSNQIQFTTNPVTFVGQYINVNKALAHGAEFEAHARVSNALNVTASYVYTSTQALAAPLCAPGTGCTAAGEPLLRRPRHFGQTLVTYTAPRWGASVAGSFVGRRPDSDFWFGLIPPVTSAAGYARVDVSGWRAIHSHVIAYASVYNALNHRYQEIVGYPALKANFRAGLRFRFGGD